MVGRRRRERNRWVRYAVLGLRSLIPRRGRRWRLVRRTGYVFGGLLLILGVAIGVMYTQVKVPPVSAAARAEASILYYRDGTQLAQVGRLNRVAVPLSAVPGAPARRRARRRAARLLP
ncbi:hypothetical protein GCM10029978_097780 [Actinoallomurus acanthiterrae]